MLVEDQIVQALKCVDLPKDLIVIKGDRDGVEPKAPYLLIQTVSDWTTATSYNTHSHKNGSDYERVYQTEYHSFTLILHASTKGGHHDWFKRFHRGLNSDLYQHAFEQFGIGIKGFSTINYQPMPIDGVNYKRAILDITLCFEVCEEFTVNTVSQVSVVGNIKNKKNPTTVLADIDYKIK